MPAQLRKLLRAAAPKEQIWAGAGAIFSESQIVKGNNEFPQALAAKLLIVGTAANGDHVAIDLTGGATGYISHEDQWTEAPRKYFVPVSPSIGTFLRDINTDPTGIPEDFWGAKRARRRGSRSSSDQRI